MYIYPHNHTHYKQYGRLLVNVTSLETLTSVCLVQMLEAVEVNGQPLQNECDCPLLTLSSTINAVSPSDILTEVSIIHECNDSCKFVEDGATIQVERETIQSKRLAYVHDWSNQWYCLNIYCMNK